MDSDPQERDEQKGPDSILLELNDVNLSIDDLHVLKNINLSIGAGEIHAIVGHHYAGK